MLVVAKQFTGNLQADSMTTAILVCYDELMFFSLSLVLAGFVEYLEALRVVKMNKQEIDSSLQHLFFVLIILLIAVLFFYITYSGKKEDIIKNKEGNLWLVTPGVVTTFLTMTISIAIQWFSKKERDAWIAKVGATS